MALYDAYHEYVAVRPTAERMTARNTNLTLTMCVNYGGRIELVDAMRTIADDVAAGRGEAYRIGEQVADQPAERGSVQNTLRQVPGDAGKLFAHLAVCGVDRPRYAEGDRFAAMLTLRNTTTRAMKLRATLARARAQQCRGGLVRPGKKPTLRLRLAQ